MLLELLEGIVRSLGQSVQAGRMEVSPGNMAVTVGEKCVRRDGVIGREPMKRVGQHVEVWRDNMMLGEL